MLEADYRAQSLLPRAIPVFAEKAQGLRLAAQQIKPRS
jgi:hypothetical protein